MSARYPGELPHPFTPAELGGMDLPADELAADGQLARELEAVADRGTVTPSPDFADRVMAAVAAEPSPAPVMAAGSAVRRLSLVAFAASLRDAVRVATGAGFPAAARAQGIALALVAVLVVGTASAATAGALGLLGRQAAPTPGVLSSASPLESPALEPSSSPADTASPEDSATPSASPSPEVSESPEPSGSAEPAETNDPADSAGSGSGGSGSGGSAATPRPARTPEPTATPRATEDGGGDHGSQAPQATPSETPQPSTSPDH